MVSSVKAVTLVDTRKNFTRTTLRIPQELYERLAEATENKRSVNAEIISRLEASFLDGPPAISRDAAVALHSLLSKALAGQTTLLGGDFDPPKKTEK